MKLHLHHCGSFFSGVADLEESRVVDLEEAASIGSSLLFVFEES